MAEPPAVIVEEDPFLMYAEGVFKSSQHIMIVLGFIYMFRSMQGEISLKRVNRYGRGRFWVILSEQWVYKNMWSLLILPFAVLFSPSYIGRFSSLLLLVDSIVSFMWIPGRLINYQSDFIFTELFPRIVRNLFFVISLSSWNLLFSEDKPYSWMGTFNLVVAVICFFYGMKKRMCCFDTVALFLYTNQIHTPSYEDFEYCTSPNHWGEVIQWLAFYSICPGPVSFGYALYKVQVAWGRAHLRQKWFHKNVPHYPLRRATIIPHLF